MSERKVMNAIKKLLERADYARFGAEEIRKTFGECGAFQNNHWQAYYLEEAAEFMAYWLLKKEFQFRNGKRP